MRFVPEYRAQARWLALGGSLLALAGLGVLRWRPELLAVTVPGFGRCLLHDLTGWPCPTCGGTRAAWLLVHGRWFDAIVANPLVTLSLLVLVGIGIVALTMTLVPGWRRSIQWTPRVRRWAAGLVAVLWIANWLYLLFATRSPA